MSYGAGVVCGFEELRTWRFVLVLVRPSFLLLGRGFGSLGVWEFGSLGVWELR